MHTGDLRFRPPGALALGPSHDMLPMLSIKQRLSGRAKLES